MRTLMRACLVILVSALAVPAIAQSPNTATLVVVVVDQTGAVVNDAKVSVVNSATGATREAVSGADGSTSIAAQYFVFEAAKAGGMKVMLDGQGADEVLGGYDHYFPLIAVALLRRRRFASYLRYSRAYRRERGGPPISRRHALATLAPRRASDAAASLMAARTRA